jgi:hypothetical protein
MHRQGQRALHRGNAVLHRLLHLLEGAHVDLAHALARDAELLGELRERDRVLGKPARLEDAPLAVVELGERLRQRLAAVVKLFAFDQRGFLIGGLVGERILPLAGITVLADRRVERGVAAEPAVHVDDILLGHAEPLGEALSD